MNAPDRPKVTVDEVIRHLKQLRATFAHAIKQSNIGPARFNELREQLLPLDVQLRNLGVTDLEVLPQMAATFVKPTRHQRRMTQRKRKTATYSQQLQRRIHEGVK